MILLSIFEDLSVINILRVGFTGIAFLLSYLTFRLLRKEQVKASPSNEMLKIIKFFMVLTVVLCAMSLASFYMENSSEKGKESLVDEIEQLKAQIQVEQAKVVELNERIEELKPAEFAYNSLKKVCNSEYFKCRHGEDLPTANSANSPWREKSEIEKIVCRTVCLN